MADNSKLGMDFEKYAGILAHPTSVPGHYGIGDLGWGSYAFVDFLERSGMNLWQVLPLSHTGFGDSPYQPFSSFAGQPLLIDLDELKMAGLVWDEDFWGMPQWDPCRVDYGRLIGFKTDLLWRAYHRFKDPNYQDHYTTNPELMADYETFKKKTDWLEDYALFMAGKDYFGGKPWYEWEDSLKKPTAAQKKEWKEKLADQMEYYRFIQFVFYRQWNFLRKYANNKGIKIMGDVPIFVAWDSVDVWSNQKLFDLNSDGYPNTVAGVPPDYFAKNGQVWGNPLYKWSEHTKTGYKWWIKRIKHQLELTDFLRIDHFRGFDRYWSVPYGDPTALNGRWVEAPGDDLFTHLQQAIGEKMPIIAEDLGDIDQSVIDLRDKFGLPGMKILQFAFENPEENSFLPHNFIRNCVCYTGTHDNDTMVGWYQKCYESSRDKLRRYFATDGHEVNWIMIRACLASVANMAIIPMQDILGHDSWARLNTPGVGVGNWAWRFRYEEMSDYVAHRLFDMCNLYGRYKHPADR